ncbi:hypothetical protein CF326_g2300 [Tilletia indica]|nr:hypothetical protein CF326_g2300 [Tilletia indica]
MGTHPLMADAARNGSGTAMGPPPAPNPVPPQTFQDINAQPAQAIALAASSVNNPTVHHQPRLPNEEDDESRVNSSLLGLGNHSMSLDMSRDADSSQAGPSSQRRPRESGSASGDEGDGDLSHSRSGGGKRARLSAVGDDQFDGPINVHKNGGLFSTAFNPYAMPDLDVLGTHWSTAARAALRGRVTGLMRFFRISGYLPPPARSENEPDDHSRKRMRVSRGYESWKCRACGTVLNPVCGETGNARKHISLGKCGGLFAPLESSLLFDQDPEVRDALLRNGARVLNADGTPAVAQHAPSNPGNTAAAPSGLPGQESAWFELANASAAEAERNAAAAAAAANAAANSLPGQNGAGPSNVKLPGTTPQRRKSNVRFRPSDPTGASPSNIKAGGADVSVSVGDTSTASLSQTPVYQQQADGSVLLVGQQQLGAMPASNSSNPALGPSAIVIGPNFRAPSALAVASYFVAVGQPPEHADSLAWRYLFDGVQGMPSAQAIREAMRGGGHQ